ncbi:hypothetical protein HYDPIDRAFT_30935 [Hydnomerulius pinastri MD-312]|uniref:Uncharacterized protein n=1 Tax=Hydnomerulius pinastri MD-312 TaxID=994086 RepID=A0A0C9VUW0_9AGAM|nr:hypothetical protein HYDPIDRAFT_30935 [Hydnomerulius pinastri MD-312]
MSRNRTTARDDILLPYPPRGGRTMLFGTLFVAGGIALFFANLHRRQRRKEDLDEIIGGAIPTWQRRVHQNNHPSYYPGLQTLQADSIPPRSKPVPPPTREQEGRHVTLATYFARPNNTPESRYQQPTPQRSSKDDPALSYTKSPDYCKSYDKTPKHWRDKKEAAIFNSEL